MDNRILKLLEENREVLTFYEHFIADFAQSLSELVNAEAETQTGLLLPRSEEVSFLGMAISFTGMLLNFFTADDATQEVTLPVLAKIFQLTQKKINQMKSEVDHKNPGRTIQ